MRCVLSAPPLQISFKSRPFSNKAYSNSAELKLGLHFGDLRACGPARAAPASARDLESRDGAVVLWPLGCATSSYSTVWACGHSREPAHSPCKARAKPAHGGFSAELNWEISLPIARAIFIPTKVASTV